jgi:hypothetical protein
MRDKKPYESPNASVVVWIDSDVITLSGIIDNDGDYRDWDDEGPGWDN